MHHKPAIKVIKQSTTVLYTLKEVYMTYTFINTIRLQNVFFMEVERAGISRNRYEDEG